MGISWPSKSTGQKLNASDWNNARSDFITGKFFDNAGSGTNFLHCQHDTTDGIVQSSTGHLKLKAPSGKELKLQVNSTDILQASGSLITASQSLKLPDGSVGTPGLHFSGDVDTGLGLISSKLALVFGGSVRADNDGSTWDLKAQALTTSGNLSTSGSGVVTGAGGVKFKASSTGSDTLSHYESAGSFTPAITYTGGGHSITYTNQTGRFQRIGNTVFVDGVIGWSAYTEGSGTIAISGLPYSLASGINTLVRVAPRSITMPAGTVQAHGIIGAGTTFNIYSVIDAGAEVGWTDANTAFAASGALFFQTVYRCS